MTKTSPTVLSTSQPDAATDQFHPGKCLPDCMMPDGGECCPGYVALYDAYWHLMRRAPAALAATPLQKSAPVTETTHNSGEGDPSVMPDSIGADTAPAVGGERTPGAVWRESGLPDPHGTYYDCERAKLALGHLSDDQIANNVFLDPNIETLTAAKERIRWLSRQLAAPPASPLRGRDLVIEECAAIAENYGDAAEGSRNNRRRIGIAEAIRALKSTSPPEQPAVQFQARKIGQDEWINIPPSQVEAMSKAGHNLRAIEQDGT